jgi:hypothetical protein
VEGIHGLGDWEEHRLGNTVSTWWPLRSQERMRSSEGEEKTNKNLKGAGNQPDSQGREVSGHPPPSPHKAVGTGEGEAIRNCGTQRGGFACVVSTS